MADGRLVPPNLDDRTWQDLVNEVRGLIPKYAPQWTDHNPSDLGMTVVELFAWLVEGMIYRLNRVPEKHYIEFLNLLGITRDPATPARTQVTFTVTGTPTDILKGTQVATPQSPTEEPVVFETDADVRVLPIDLAHMLLSPRDRRLSKLLASAGQGASGGDHALHECGGDRGVGAGLQWPFC